MHIIIFILFSLIYSNNSSDKIIIHLLTTNDIHGNIAEDEAYWLNPDHPPTVVGFSGFSKYVYNLRKEVLKKNEEVILLDGGNFFQGHPIGMYDSGKTMIEWFNRLEYDAIVPGRYDFILGLNKLNQMMEEANFPFLGSNIFCDDCPLVSNNIKPYIIKEISGIKIGILGIIDSRIENLVLEQNREGLEIQTEKISLEKWIQPLKQKSDIVIILTSSGMPYDLDEEYNLFLDSVKNMSSDDNSLNALEMGYFAQGADLIVSGGNSVGYDELWYDPYSHVYSVQNYGNSFSHLILEIDSSTKSLNGVSTAIDGKVSQSLLADDFYPDLNDLDWIRDREISALSQVNINNENSKYFKKNFEGDNSVFQFDNWDFPNINSEKTIDAITWNCEFFPHAHDSTIQALAEAISDLSPDIIGFQEIVETGWFSKLMTLLPEYNFIVSKNSSFMDQAIIFKEDIFSLNKSYELFTDNDYYFAGRPPLVADLEYNDGNKSLLFSVINIHMKCCNSGLSRRQEAVKMLYRYVLDNTLNYETQFIILGDWNDDLKDDPLEHSFHPFIEDDKFFFPTRDITYDLSQASYPKEPYVSFLDHILVSRSLIPNESNYEVMTLPMDKYMGSFEIYESYISDHLPVLFSFEIP